MTETLTDCSQAPYTSYSLRQRDVQEPVHYTYARWESHEINAEGPYISTALSLTRSNSVLSRSLAAILRMHERVTSVNGHVTSVTVYVMSITALL